MHANWLFQIPSPSLTESQAIIQTRLDADPDARKIRTEEAEAFMVSAYHLAFAAPSTFAAFARAFGLRGQTTNRAFRRQATLIILKSWYKPHTQELLTMARGNVYMKGLGSDNEVTASLPIEDLVEAYYQGHMVVWLCHLLRLSDRSDQIPDFLAMLDEYAESKYNLYLDVGRLMFRRIVDGVAQPTPESTQGADQITAQLRQKTKGAAQVKREVARQREAIAREKRWRKAKDRTLSAYLESIRQEVTAAEGELIATLHQNEAEVTALQAEHQAQLDHVAAEIARVEAAFAESVRAQTSALPLAGLRIALQGEWGAAEQLLIESAGGQIVAARPDLTLCLGAPGPDMPARFCTTAFGPVGLERLLHRKVLPQITQFRPT